MIKLSREKRPSFHVWSRNITFDVFHANEF